ncbi:MAG: glycosyltransferase family 39 protein [Planctomycetaceae bacterium]|nr:glycosyltransferase family 39 protein [Planctomycetaceae bacterium]
MVATRPTSVSNGVFWLWVFLILLLALGLRLGAAWIWQSRAPEDSQLVWGDSTTYWEIAENWVETNTYQFGEPPQRIFRTPGYPVVLIAGMQVAEFFGTSFSVFHARLIGCVFGTLAVWLLIGWTTDLSGDRRVGLLAGALMAIEPGAMAMSVFVLAEAAFVPLMILSLWAWTMAWRQESFAKIFGLAIMTGVITGIAILVRPSWLLFAPCTVALAFVFYSQRTKQFAIAIGVGLGIVVSMMPWWYRNYELTGRWVMTTLQVGASLYDGWHPQADGGSDMTYGYQVTRPLLQRYRADLERRLLDEDPVDLDKMSMELELACNDLLLKESWNWGLQNPGRLCQLAGLKVWRTWRPWPAAAEVQSPLITAVTVAAFIPVMLFGMIGFWKQSRRDYAWAICVWPAIYVTLLHAVFVGSVRYRQPAIVPLLVLVAVVLGSYLWSQKGNWEKKEP